jgi:hypothetical protein
LTNQPSLARIFGACALAALAAFPLAGCADNYAADAGKSDNPLVTVTHEQASQDNIFSDLQEGSSLVTFPAAEQGTPNDLTCLAIKEKDGMGKYTEYYSALSCDWQSAADPAGPGPQVTAPAIKTLAQGHMLAPLQTGSHRITYPGAMVGTPGDLQCMAVKSMNGMGAYTSAYSGVSCNWAGARRSAP